ncbi:MAG: POTRA domain-containing protein, partial [bacterium]|nr:POTRA domain-containing protein [bacterium]
MKKFIIKIIAAVLLIFTKVGYNQPDSTQLFYQHLSIEGNRRLRLAEIEKRLPTGGYTDEKLKRLIKSLLIRYRDQGLYFSQIDAVVRGDTLKLSIEEGNNTQLAAIFLNVSDTELLSQLESLLDLRQKQAISHIIVRNIETMLNFLENSGYPFAKVIVDSLSLKADSINFTNWLSCHLTVDAGQSVVIDSIHVQGNELTRPHVVIRAARIKQGDLYNQAQINRVPERLMKTGYFTHVEQPQIFIDKSGKGQLLIQIKEGNPNQFQAVIGYNPGVADIQSGYVTGIIDIDFKNLLGSGRIAQARWQKKDQRSQALRFRYLEPWIRGYPVNAGFGFSQNIQDTSFVKRNWGVDLEFAFSDLFTIFTHLGRESVLPDSIAQLSYGLPKSRSWLIQLGFSYDTRDNIQNPLRGLYYSTMYEYGRKTISLLPESIEVIDQTQTSFRRNRWEIDSEILLPTFRWQTIMLGFHGRKVKSGEKFASVADLYRFGGTGSMRGY